MCGRFTSLTYDEVADVIKEIEVTSPLNIMPDWPATRPNAYPKMRVTIIRPDEEKSDAKEKLVPAELQWGFPVEWQQGVVFNTRIESAGKPLWRDSLTHRRCLVPALSFFEPHQSEMALSPRTQKPIKRPYEFTLPGRGVLLMAAIWKEDWFSILTTEPNASVAPIHPRMPLVIAQDEIDTWLHGDYGKLVDRSGIKLTTRPELPLAQVPTPKPPQTPMRASAASVKAPAQAPSPTPELPLT